MVDGDEECDDGQDNGKVALDGCTEGCTYFGSFELVLSMSSGGTATKGSFEDAHDRVVNKMEDCRVRFDNRLADVRHIEYTNTSLRFDFQELNAWHNNWDSYAFAYVEKGVKAGFGASYRRGHDNEVWKKDNQQHGIAYWQGTQVDVYCERESAYAHVATFDGAGNAKSGTWDDLYSQVAEQGATCKLKYDGRIATSPHVEYAQNKLYFDFLGLHAHWDGWDTYAYIDITPGSRAGIGAAYRRGHENYIWKKDRQQHGEAEWHNMTVAVHCRNPFANEFIISALGVVTKGTWDDLYSQVADEARECKVMYDNRSSEPKYVEYTDNSLRFDFMNLHAYHDSWDSFASVLVTKGGTTGVRANYRRGHANVIWNKTLSQHSDKHVLSTTVRVRCSDSPTFTKIFTISGAGADLFNTWDGFFTSMADTQHGFDCRLRYDGRLTMPVLMEHGNQGSDYLFFDFLSLTAFHNGWDSYSTVSVRPGITSGFGSSYRRGHANEVWKRDRQQHLLYDLHGTQLEFLCR